MTVAQLHRSMSVREFNRWFSYYKDEARRKQEADKKAKEGAKNKRGRRR